MNVMKKNRGFSIGELVVALVLMGILATFAVSTLSNLPANARLKAAAANAESVNAAKTAYRNRVANADVVWGTLDNGQRFGTLRDPNGDGDLSDTFLPMAPATLGEFMPEHYSLEVGSLFTRAVLSRTSADGNMEPESGIKY